MPVVPACRRASWSRRWSWSSWRWWARWRALGGGRGARSAAHRRCFRVDGWQAEPPCCSPSRLATPPWTLGFVPPRSMRCGRSDLAPRACGSQRHGWSHASPAAGETRSSSPEFAVSMADPICPPGSACDSGDPIPAPGKGGTRSLAPPRLLRSRAARTRCSGRVPRCGWVSSSRRWAARAIPAPSIANAGRLDRASRRVRVWSIRRGCSFARLPMRRACTREWRRCADQGRACIGGSRFGSARPAMRAASSARSLSATAAVSRPISPTASDVSA